MIIGKFIQKLELGDTAAHRHHCDVIIRLSFLKKRIELRIRNTAMFQATLAREIRVWELQTVGHFDWNMF
jgi:hypothetical protein